VYEVVNMLVIIGKRGHLSQEEYRVFYDEGGELAAMISGAISPHTSASEWRVLPLSISLSSLYLLSLSRLFVWTCLF